MAMALAGKTLESRMAAIWTLGSCGGAAGVPLADDPIPAVRAWSARFLGEGPAPTLNGLSILQKLAADKDPTVLAGVAIAARRIQSLDTTPILTTLLRQPAAASDPHLPFLIWMATEPLVMQHVSRHVTSGAAPGASPGGQSMTIKSELRAPDVLVSLANETGNIPAAGDLARRIVRRVVDAQDAAALSRISTSLNALTPEQAAIAKGSLQGFLESQQKKGGQRPAGLSALDLGKLQSHVDKVVATSAARLAALWGNAAAAEAGLKPLADPKASDDDRLAALDLARKLGTDAARKAVLAFLSGNATDALKLEAIRALGEIGTDESADAIFNAWKTLTPETRRGSVEVLVSRLTWTKALLKAIEAKVVSTDDVSAVALRTLSRQKDEGVQAMVKKVIGAVRPSDPDKLKIIEAKKKIMLDGTAIDYEAGHQLAQKTCLVCHTFYAEGKHVGPDLTGVGRSSIDALLHNVIDPNEIIGAGYENTLVETKDHRSLAGRLIENTDDHIKLLSTGDKEDVVGKSEIASMRTEKISVMPEGLVDAMPDGDLRNLLWYIFSPPREHGAKNKKP
jgi:putative heme-binding domain-containing protein